jgi:hypothetical protein
LNRECSTILSAVAAALSKCSNAAGLANAEYFARLAKRISIHLAEVGKGAGLTGGVMREDAFVDMLESALPGRISRSAAAGATSDADYYIDGIPVSHKSISGPAGSELALSWSKNPGGSPGRVFEANMTILFLPQEPRTISATPTSWQSLPSGIYVIDMQSLEAIRAQGKLVSNNKSDNIIPRQELLKLLVSALDDGRFIAVKGTDSPVAHGRLSLWKLAAPDLRG